MIIIIFVTYIVFLSFLLARHSELGILLINYLTKIDSLVVTFDWSELGTADLFEIMFSVQM